MMPHYVTFTMEPGIEEPSREHLLTICTCRCEEQNRIIREFIDERFPTEWHRTGEMTEIKTIDGVVRVTEQGVVPLKGAWYRYTVVLPRQKAEQVQLSITLTELHMKRESKQVISN